MPTTLIQERVAEVKETIRHLAPDRTVSLMAVTKYRTCDEVLQAVDAGVDLVGENRMQEAVQKWGSNRPPVPLHMVGHLQTNKVKYGIDLFDSFDSIDSDRLARAIHQRASGVMPVMVEVNVGHEATKTGLAPEDTVPFIASMERYPNLRVTGLMTVLPARRENSVEESRRIRHHMQEMVDLWRMCRSEGFPWAPTTELSMGMTGDWQWAIEAGSTMIRLGTFLFGPRPTMN